MEAFELTKVLTKDINEIRQAVLEIKTRLQRLEEYQEEALEINASEVKTSQECEAIVMDMLYRIIVLEKELDIVRTTMGFEPLNRAGKKIKPKEEMKE